MGMPTLKEVSGGMAIQHVQNSRNPVTNSEDDCICEGIPKSYESQNYSGEPLNSVRVTDQVRNEGIDLKVCGHGNV